MGEYYVGLDVHSRESVFVIQHADGTIVARGSVPTDGAGLRRLRDAHGLPPGTPVALETGTLAFFAARQLAELELGPVVIDAHEVRANAHGRRAIVVTRSSSATGSAVSSIARWCMCRAQPSATSARPCPAAATSCGNRRRK